MSVEDNIRMVDCHFPMCFQMQRITLSEIPKRSRTSRISATSWRTGILISILDLTLPFQVTVYNQSTLITDYLRIIILLLYSCRDNPSLLGDIFLFTLARTPSHLSQSTQPSIHHSLTHSLSLSLSPHHSQSHSVINQSIPHPSLSLAHSLN